MKEVVYTEQVLLQFEESVTKLDYFNRYCVDVMFATAKMPILHGMPSTKN